MNDEYTTLTETADPWMTASWQGGPSGAMVGGMNEGKRGLRAGLHRTRMRLVHVITTPDASVLDVIGGRRGLADALGPNVLFLVVYLATTDIVWATVSALAVCAFLALGRATAGQPVGPAIGGMILVALSGLMAVATGNDGDFFLIDLLQTGVFSVILLGSILIRRPLLGVMLAPVLADGATWRTNPTLLRAYSWATAVWAVAAAIRTVSKIPFYLEGNLLGLGVVDMLTGIPLAVLTFYYQLRILRDAYTRQCSTAAAKPLERQLL